LRTAVDSLNLELINPVPEDEPLKGGVKDLGNFDEGNCIELSTIIPKSYKKDFDPTDNASGVIQKWITCTDSVEAKAELLALLLKSVTTSQRDHDRVMTSDHMNRPKVPKFDLSFGKKKPSAAKNKASPVKKEEEKAREGYWVMLQDWTKCSLSCGGGQSFQQWMCIPPKNGGQPCEGEAVRTKACNTQECPEVKNLVEAYMKKDDKKQSPAAPGKPSAEAKKLQKKKKSCREKTRRSKKSDRKNSCNSGCLFKQAPKIQ